MRLHLKGRNKMKRCPNCEFPNTDSDVHCFKCGTVLPEEKPIEKVEEKEEKVEETGSIQEPLEFEAPTFNAQENITTFIHTPTEAPSPEPEPETVPPLAQEETCVTSEMPVSEQTPPPVTRPTLTLPPPTRILPKYKWLPRFGLASKILGVIMGLVFIFLSIGFFLVLPSIFTLALGLVGVCFGLLHCFMGFVLAAVLNWLNDAECNQRRQQEILHHIYHKLPE